MQTADAMDRQNMQNKLRAHKASLGRHKTDLASPPVSRFCNVD